MSLLPALNPPLSDWHGKTAWVIGASSGIGRATAEALLAAGARVAVSARNEEALNAWAAVHAACANHPDSCTQAIGSRVQVLALDVTDAQAVADAYAQLRSRGPVDLVLHCAGTYQPQRADAFDLRQMLAHNRVNYIGALNMLAAVLPDFVARRAGHVSLVASVAAYRGLPKSLAYGPTKAALTNLAEVLYLDLHPYRVGVSVVQPGFVETPLTAQNDFKMPGLISPAQAAAHMLDGWREGRFEIHFPRRFTLWLKLLRMLPYRLSFALVRRVTGA